jgi:thiol-disulfide isomerase/thioredoxin
MIRKLLLALSAIIGAASCSSNSTCTITGSVSPQVDSVWLVGGTGNHLDAAAVRDGVFTLSCKRDSRSGVALIPGPKSEPVSLIPDSKEITVKIEDGIATVTGSPLSEELQELQNWIMAHFTSYNEKAVALAESGDEAGAEALWEEMHKTMAEHCKEVYLNHLSDPVGVQAMSILVSDASDEEFISLYEKGGECIHSNPKIAGRYESLTATEKTVIQLNPSGDDFIESKGNLSDFIGQGAYVLVDFWASWCGPCKEETPFVIKAYNDYKDKGLIVLGIPIQDKMEATKDAMKQMGIYYPQLFDPGAAALAEEYGVAGIPHLFLFGPDGKVLQDGMRGEGIDAALKPIFQK